MVQLIGTCQVSQEAFLLPRWPFLLPAGAVFFREPLLRTRGPPRHPPLQPSSGTRGHRRCGQRDGGDPGAAGVTAARGPGPLPTTCQRTPATSSQSGQPERSHISSSAHQRHLTRTYSILGHRPRKLNHLLGIAVHISNRFQAG